MNSIIKQQLQKCVIAKIPEFDDQTTDLIIPKQQTQGSAGLKLEHYYQISLAQCLTQPPPGSSLAVNWNKGVVPGSTVMRVYPVQKLGEMVRVEGYGYDTETGQIISSQYYPELWLPIKDITIEKELEI